MESSSSVPDRSLSGDNFNGNLRVELCEAKVSDFSIDHILNRAGENINKLQNNEDNSNDHLFYYGHLPSHHRIEFPMFDWLHYTRYHPPKLPRPLRNGPAKRTPGRLPRVPFTPSQLNALEAAYKNSTYLSSEEANRLAEELDLTNTRVKIWFQNRRARERREKREHRDEKFTNNSSSSSSSSPERELYKGQDFN